MARIRRSMCVFMFADVETPIFKVEHGRYAFNLLFI